MTRTGIEETAGDFQAVNVKLFGVANGEGGRPRGNTRRGSTDWRVLKVDLKAVKM